MWQELSEIADQFHFGARYASFQAFDTTLHAYPEKFLQDLKILLESRSKEIEPSIDLNKIYNMQFGSVVKMRSSLKRKRNYRALFETQTVFKKSTKKKLISIMLYYVHRHLKSWDR